MVPMIKIAYPKGARVEWRREIDQYNNILEFNREAPVLFDCIVYNEFEKPKDLSQYNLSMQVCHRVGEDLGYQEFANSNGTIEFLNRSKGHFRVNGTHELLEGDHGYKMYLISTDTGESLMIHLDFIAIKDLTCT